jgi:hypothetical protein
MMLLGYLGVLVFNRPFTPPPGQPDQIFSNFDFLCIGSLIFGIAGGIVCLIALCWIFFSAVLSMFRRKQA